MFEFDVRTAFLIVGFLYFLLPGIAWLVLAKQRSVPVALWCTGGILLGIASVLTGMQAVLPNWAALTLASVSFHCSNLIRIQSLRMDLGIPWKKRWIGLALLAITVGFHGIQYGLGNAVLRAQFTSLVGAGLIFYLAVLAWRIGTDEQSSSAKWVAVVYVLAALTFLYRVVFLLGFQGTAGVVNEGWGSSVIAVVMLMAAVVGHLGYVGLHLDRAVRRELQAAADLARDEESRRLGQQIAQLDRQRSLGEISASLGHELNQPLTAILTNAQVTRRGIISGHFAPEQQVDFLDKIIYNTQRASQIIERIRSFIRPSTVRMELFDLGRTVLEVGELVAGEARSQGIRFVLPQGADRMWVRADPIQISQIILNVYRNAIEALNDSVQGEIHVYYRQANGYVILSIHDNGPGFQSELLAQIGTPFFTTKSTGLGVGLSISRTIAARFGGALAITNAESGGALVELRLPAPSQASP